ncbi:ABC transporter substrate-binding protein [Rathayibacter soli]|uniref:ABC transporter substrate-binding protein n=1 Tax=Rathayibacter soli TaxID=3144168 RepID=UPI0027E46B6C|nr:sugar ABC transporter substrate-binding protein [Glaciibacter superstes]
MQRRSIRALAAGVAVLTLGMFGLTACSGAPASSASTEKITLTYGIWDKNQEPAMKQMVAAFEKQNPNITIDIQLTANADYWTKLQTAASAGSAPDVFWMNGPNFQLYASNGQLAPLDNVKKSDYPSNLIDLYTYDNKLYGAPKDFDTVGVWYNKKLFDAAGVAYPKAGWTWDEFTADAKALTNKTTGTFGVAAPPYGQENYYDTVAQAGGYIISKDGKKSGYDNPKTIEGVKFWLDLVKDGASPSLQQMTDTYSADLFTSGKIAMYWAGSWNPGAFAKSSIAADINVAPLPQGPTGNQSIIHGLANVVSAKSAHLDAAKKFAAFASGKTAADFMAKSGAVIPAFNGTQTLWVKSLPNYDLQSYINEVKTAVPFPISRNTAAWNADETAIFSKVWSGSLDLDAGMKQLAALMNAALAKE